MRRTLLALVLGSMALSVSAAEPTRQVKLNGQTFTLPQGFTIELAAGPSLVPRPITADFDEQGRLYVSNSSGSNEPVAEQLKKKPHRIVRLEDTDGDGKFDKSIVFADQMMFPEGTMWYAGSLYVAAPPSIWKLTDTDGDGKADQRVEWFQGKTLTGCANDLHGPYLGPDGWIYWCKGAFAEQKHKLPSGKDFVTKASHIFRCRPDGGGLEPVMTGGMDNPVDVVFTPGGERIFTTTFFQHPGGGKRDGLIHAVYGGIYGKDHNVIHDPAHKWTGPDLMPVLTHMGAAAPCGLHRYESSAFGKDYQDNLFAAQFNMHKISRHVLTPKGATFESRDEDFVVSDSLDFHPTDVLEDADGSLLIVDTGGWYKLCCPTSQLVKPDVLGALYRVRRKGAAKVEDQRGLKLMWATMNAKDLAGLLDDPRPAVRKRTIELLGAMGTDAVKPLGDVIHRGRTAEARRNAVWAATHIDHPAAREVARAALKDDDATVRQAGIHSISVRRDTAAANSLLSLLEGDFAHNRRAAAEALGRLGDRSAIPSLLVAAGVAGADRELEHSITYAMIEIGNIVAIADGLVNDKLPGTRRAALIALDQVNPGLLGEKGVFSQLEGGTNERVREAAWWIVGRRSEWGPALLEAFRKRVIHGTANATEQEILVALMARSATSPPIQELLAERLRDPSARTEEHRIVLRAMARANLKETPPAWAPVVARVLARNDPELEPEALGTARALRFPKGGDEPLVKELRWIADNQRAPLQTRIACLEIAQKPNAAIQADHFQLLLAHAGVNEPVVVRSVAASALSRAKLSKDQLLSVIDELKQVAPTELERVLDAFTASTDEEVGIKLLAALKNAPGRDSLRAEVLRERLKKYPTGVQKQAEELYALLNVDAAKQRTRLEELLTAIKDKPGDIRRGQQVFHSQKTACATCHAIGYLGGKTGPDLTQIARIRNERDLLEAVVFPSMSLVRSYEPILVVTNSGKTHNGLIKSETPDEILLTTGVNQEVRIARKDIEEIQPSKVSIMPSGLDQQLTPQELADLVAFLKACK